MAAGRQSRNLTEGSIFAHLMRMVIPMSFGIVAMMAVGVIDAYWVGKLGTSQQAAVQFVFPISMAVMSIAIGLGAGASSVVARAAGRGDDDRTKRLATDAILLSFSTVLITSAIGIMFIDELFTAMGASEAMMPHIKDYMQIWYGGIVFIVGPMIAGNILRALGDAILPSLIMIFAAIFNMILDPILIFGWGPVPEMGVQGAALATLISNLAVFIGSMAILIFREKLIDLDWPGFEEVLSNWKEIAHVGLPAAGSNMISPLSMSIAFSAMARFGDPAVAGFGVANRVEAFAIIPLFALSAGIGPITGQNGGAGKTDRVREAFITSFLFATGWSLIMAVILFFVGDYLAGAFLPSEQGQATAEFYWDIVPFTVAGYGIAMAASAGFNGLGRPLYGISINFLRGLVLLAPLTWILGSTYQAEGVVYGVALANIITAVCAVILVLRFAPLNAVDSKSRPKPKPVS